ncbi:MAG: GNAT family N-acetyltransferase [Chloroflexi bacterium]|nr:GNAT family N-acetyltransferase [Chloroflexota bacterium]MBP8057333.1 GNAT family N-acetyltransferase [Chloroflexota bacterium]
MNANHSTIRRAEQDEAQTITEMVVQSKAHWGYSDEFMEYAAALLTVTPDYLDQYHCYVLEQEGQLQGFASWQAQTAAEGVLDMLFVAPSAMGQGVGRQLLEFVKGIAAAHGYHSLIVESDPNAAPFYEKMGGQLIGHHPVPSIPGRELPLYRIYLDTDLHG